MDSRLKILLLLMAGAFAYSYFGDDAAKDRGHFVVSESNGQHFESEEFTFTNLENFRIKARVLSRKRYSGDPESELSPIDLALGWGPMSDKSVLKDIKISQRNRWYYWNVDQFPIPRRDIEIHSANMHMIPASAEVEEKLLAVKKHDIIELKGKLVEIVNKSNGWRWRSSTTREDTGDGACEVIWVEDFSIVAPNS